MKVRHVIVQIPVDELHLGLDFRLDDDPDSLAELAVSIGEVGILQPLVVREAGGGWEVVAGRRRLAAARLAGLADVPCLCRDLSDDEAADIALVENVHRRDLSPVEEGLAFARLRSRGLGQSEIAARVGRSQGHVSRLLRVLDLPEGLRSRVHRRELSYTTALDLYARRRTSNPGGVSTHGQVEALTGETAGIATYWRARHERLLVGLQKAARAQTHGLGPSAVRHMLDRLLELDGRPVPGLAEQVAS